MVDRDLLRRKLTELAEYVGQVSEYRNVIVHEYAQIDADTVIRILQEHLEDFRRFETEALRWL
ncbi:MAG: HepT-like ribonuclease domain-containing protein [Candidatus Rokuibacteriota bacterium]